MPPFLKWPRGKRWFIAHHANLLPNTFNRYIEPFLGSGSVFFSLCPERALLGDANADLIAAYQGVKNNWVELERLLHEHHKKHNKTHYYKVREAKPTDPVKRAARFIYLNRTCFNGIYRVNLQGKFNVPMGTKNSVLLDHDDFKQAAHILAKAEMRVSDFQFLIDEAQSNDLVFADPPYTVRHNLNGFINYNEVLFSWEDQQRLSIREPIIIFESPKVFNYETT